MFIIYSYRHVKVLVSTFLQACTVLYPPPEHISLDQAEDSYKFKHIRDH